MKAPKGIRLTLDFALPLAPQDGSSIELSFDSIQKQPIGVGLGDSAIVGQPTLSQPRFLLAKSWGSSKFLGWPVSLPIVERPSERIYTDGWQSSSVSEPGYVSWRKFIDPTAMVEKYNVPMPSLRRGGGYQLAPGENIILNFAEPLVPPPGNLMVLEFGAEGYGRILGVSVGNTALFGAAYLTSPEQLRAFGFNALSFGGPSIEGSIKYVGINQGIQVPDQQVGSPRLTKRAAALLAKGFDSSAHGNGAIFNWNQYLYAGNFTTSFFGKPYLLGGVKYITPSGISWPGTGSAKLVNTTATQVVRPESIKQYAVPNPSVSPRSIRVYGILGAAIGYPLVQFPPSPKGWQSSRFGYPIAEYKTKLVKPGGISADELLGYPTVFDLTRKLYVTSANQEGVFGDTYIKSNRLFLYAMGFDSFYIPPWPEVRNTRRTVTASGNDNSRYGDGEIKNSVPTIAPQGFDSLKGLHESDAAIGYAERLVYTRGADALTVGLPVLTKTPQIDATGFDSMRVGLTTIWSRVRALEVEGLSSQKIGKHDVWFKYRIIELEGKGHNSSVYGKPRIEDEHRTLLVNGSDHAKLGLATIGVRNRIISVDGIWEEKASGHVVGGLRYIKPIGYEATRWGARVIPEITEVMPLGFSNLYGWPTIRSNRKVVTPVGITTTDDPVDRWGKTKVWNSAQYVSMFYDVDSDLNPPRWSQWTIIENRNYTARPAGNVMSRLGYVNIANAATPIYPQSITNPSWAIGYKAGLVAYRIRPLRMDGLEAPYMGSWAVVLNDAPVLGSKGFNAELFGNAALENTRRYYKIQGWADSWLGYPMVADRIRTIDIESRYGIAPPIIRMPWAKLYTRYIEPQGEDYYGSGAQSLSIHWTLITPRWTHMNFFGEPRIHNVTPELRTRGRNSEEFGDTFVRLEWRGIETNETFTQIIPRPIIAYRDRAIPLTGINSMIVSDKLKVIKLGAPPYSEQVISLQGLQDPDTGEQEADGYGIKTPKDQVPRPIMNQQVLYHRSEDPMTKFGSHRATANTIRVEPGFQELSVGEPMVSSYIRYLTVPEFPKKEIFEPSKARVSPHTIYAFANPPKQAIDNHLVRTFYPIGSSANGGWKKGVGQPNITLQYRSLKVLSRSLMTGYGRAYIFNRLSYINARGFSSYRAGWHTVPGNRELVQMPTPATIAFGSAKVGRPPYIGPLSIKPKGLHSADFGTLLIENQHRNIYPQGYLAERVGSRKQGDSPYQWQGLRIGELMPTIPEGFNAELLGEPWVSFRVRELLTEGHDSFVSEYDLENFRKRMRVSRIVEPIIPVRVTPVGFDAFDSTAPNVRPLTHYIRPDGDSDQYRKGAF